MALPQDPSTDSRLLLLLLQGGVLPAAREEAACEIAAGRGRAGAVCRAHPRVLPRLLLAEAEAGSLALHASLFKLLVSTDANGVTRLAADGLFAGGERELLETALRCLLRCPATGADALKHASAVYNALPMRSRAGPAEGWGPPSDLDEGGQQGRDGDEACRRGWYDALHAAVERLYDQLAAARPSPIPSLCTHLTRAGIEWRRCRHAVCMAWPYKEPHHSGRAEP